MVTLKLNLLLVVFPWKPGFVTILSAFKIPRLTAEHHVTTTVEKCCYPKSACDSWVLCYESLHNCVGDILCFDVCEWDRKMRLTSRCLLFLCNFHSHSVFVCVCVCYQSWVRRVSRPRTGQAPVTRMSRSKLGRPRREQRPSTETWTQSGRKSSACKSSFVVFM